MSCKNMVSNDLNFEMKFQAEYAMLKEVNIFVSLLKAIMGPEEV